jgi:hypothetical protein
MSRKALIPCITGTNQAVPMERIVLDVSYLLLCSPVCRGKPDQNTQVDDGTGQARCAGWQYVDWAGGGDMVAEVRCGDGRPLKSCVHQAC